MEANKLKVYLTFLLAIVAGYCDTLTFVAADEIFSAHVTGNFIVFAYDIINNSDGNSWLRLITFPVFIIAVMAGGWLAARTVDRYRLLLIEGIILLVCGLAAFLFPSTGTFTFTVFTCSIVMTIVFAMGIQNAFGKIYSAEIYGPTTMMTGNVTQAALDLRSLITGGASDPAIWASFFRQCVLIGGFLVGCLTGALAGEEWGLYMVAIPGIILIGCFYSISSAKRS